jgi:hypothetical protein
VHFYSREGVKIFDIFLATTILSVYYNVIRE